VGVRSGGPLVGLAACAALLVAHARGSRRAAMLATLGGLAACALLVWRWSTPGSDPLLEVARSQSALTLAFAGSVLVSAGGALALIGAGALVGRGTEKAEPRERAPQRPDESPESAALGGERRESLAAAWRAFWTSRLLVWAAGVLGFLHLGVERTITPPPGSRPFGSLGNLLTSPSSSWDADAYLTIAQHGYASGLYFKAFFPLYPTLVRAGAWSPEMTLVSAILVSMAALVAALYLLHRLVTLELGSHAAGRAVTFTAFFPMAFFFSAAYTESLFLALSIGALYAARREWWARAGIAGALAAATRPTGFVLLLPLMIVYLYGPRGDKSTAASRSAPRRVRARLWPRYAVRPDFAFLFLVPLGALAFFAYQGAHGDLLAPLHAQENFWDRSFVPLAGALHGFTDAVTSLHQIAVGPNRQVLATPTVQTAGQLADPSRLAVVNLIDFGFLAFAVLATVGAIRRLPPAYGAYCAATIAVAVSTFPPYEPLASLPRYVTVLFPCQIWLALWTDDAQRRQMTLVTSAGLLAFFTALFATWRWVA